MYDYDYMISFNRDGEPFICHSLFGGTKKRSEAKNHKYIARVQERTGFRYFYTPEELKAYYNQGVSAAKNAVGITARENLKSAKEKAAKANFLNRGSRNRKLQRAQEAYSKTALGKAEATLDRAKERGAKLVNTIKTEAGEIRRKQPEETAGGSGMHAGRQRNVTGTAAPGSVYKRSSEPAGTTDEAREEKFTAKKAERVETAAPPKTKSSFSTYTEGDPDFNDANYKEENRIGDTDFFVHKRRDGTSVLLEEDMKWVLPKDTDTSSPEFRKAIESFSSEVETQRSLNKKTYTADEWVKGATSAIDNAIRQGHVKADLNSDNARSEKAASKQAERTSENQNGSGAREGLSTDDARAEKAAAKKAEQAEKSDNKADDLSTDSAREEKIATKKAEQTETETNKSNDLDTDSAREEKIASKNAEKTEETKPATDEEAQKKAEADAIADIRRIASNSDRSLSTQERIRLGKEYGLDEKMLNIIDGNLRHPDNQGPNGQKWIDNFIKKNMTLPKANGNTASGTAAGSASSDSNKKTEEKAAGGDDKSGSEQKKIDPKKVSADYVMSQASSRGLDTATLQTADYDYLSKQRAYNKILTNRSSTNQELAAARMELDKAKKAYEKELQNLADKLNE